MTFDDDPAFAPEPGDRTFGKRDRLARMLRVVAVLRGHPDGIRPAEIARRTGVATRTVYRDLRALEEEVGVAVWSEDGRWGVVGEIAMSWVLTLPATILFGYLFGSLVRIVSGAI